MTCHHVENSQQIEIVGFMIVIIASSLASSEITRQVRYNGTHGKPKKTAKIFRFTERTSYTESDAI